MAVMTLPEYMHELFRKEIKPGDVVIDATAGNGKDTLELARLVAPTGKVYAFDVQKEALEQTRLVLEGKLLTQVVELIQAGHERWDRFVPVGYHRKLKAAVFNLGYLPGGDKAITTMASSTLMAIQSMLPHLVDDGFISIIAYPGHPAGAEEVTVLERELRKLEMNQYLVWKHEFLNRVNMPPVGFVVRRTGRE